jgi:hypothetical protein
MLKIKILAFSRSNVQSQDTVKFLLNSVAPNVHGFALVNGENNYKLRVWEYIECLLISHGFSWLIIICALSWRYNTVGLLTGIVLSYLALIQSD